MWNPWKKKATKEGVEKPAAGEEGILERVCGGDKEVYGFTRGYLCMNPLASVSPKPLDELMKEAAESGDYRPPLDKAIFEASQKPEQRQNYEAIVKDIAAKTITSTEQEIAKAEKQGLIDRANFLRKRIEDQKTLQSKTGDIIDTATRYYHERVIELNEDKRKAERIAHLQEIEGERWSEELAEHDERKGMGRAERKQAELAADKKRKTLEGEAREAELEEQKLEAQEEAAREDRLEHLNKT